MGSGALNSRLALGLARPESPEGGEDVTTIPGMRRAIEQAARSSRVIKECFEMARRHQLEREEIYVLLAYQALVELEDKNRVLESLKTRLLEYAISEDPDGHF